MCLYLCSELLEVLDNGTIDGSAQVCVLICYGARLVAYVVIDILRIDIEPQLFSNRWTRTCNPPSPKN